MTKQRREAIYSFAEKIRSLLALETPVDLYTTIKTKLHGDCIDDELDEDVSGKIEKIGESFKITLNSLHAQTRRNFTIAHELGHLFLHMGYLIDTEKWNAIKEYIDSPYYRMGYSEEEYEANHFAGALLMPKTEYRAFIHDHAHDNTIAINSISKYFDVSDDAALTRGRWLGIFAWE